MSRCESAAIVPNTSELLPEPETPVNTVSRRFGISRLTSFRLLTRAPCTRIRSWLSAALNPLPTRSHQPRSVTHQRAARDLVGLTPRLESQRPEDEEHVGRGVAGIPIGLRHEG